MIIKFGENPSRQYAYVVGDRLDLI